jgi:hypothetical protein
MLTILAKPNQNPIRKHESNREPIEQTPGVTAAGATADDGSYGP